MISATIDRATMNKLKAALADTPKKIKRELSVAINATAKRAVAIAAKEVSRELATPQKNIKDVIKTKTKSTATTLSATVQVKKTDRLSLRHFGARQNKKGVSYKTSKRTGRKLLAGAFQGPKPGIIKPSWQGTVFKRAGKARLPIVKLMGPSPWGAFVIQDMRTPTKAYTKTELKKQVERRIRFITLKKAGVIPHATT